MAIHVVVAIRDEALQAFARPWVVPTHALAIRSFGDEVRRDSPENPMFAHPSDYSLFQVGSFDEESGLLTPVSPPVRLATALEYRSSDHASSQASLGFQEALSPQVSSRQFEDQGRQS